jgi:hypothetical protein
MRSACVGTILLVAVACAACGGAAVERRVAYANGRRDQAAAEAERWVAAVPRCDAATTPPLDPGVVELEGAVVSSSSMSVTLLECDDARVCCNRVRPDAVLVRGTWNGVSVSAPIAVDDSAIFPPMFHPNGGYDCEWDEWSKALTRRHARFRLRGRWEHNGKRPTFHVAAACRVEDAPK